jgi:PAS domain S-box-containing protein
MDRTFLESTRLRPASPRSFIGFVARCLYGAERAATIGAVAVAAIALAVVTGWFIQSALLVQLAPSFAPMQFNTALCLLFFASALLCVAVRRRPAWTLALAGLGTALAGLSGVQYVLGASLGLDELFVKPFIAVKTSHPGRMAPNSAICFMLLGVSLMSVARSDRRPAQLPLAGILVSLSLGLALVALGGYALRLDTAFGWGRLSGMALHTSLGLILLGAPVLLLCLKRGLSPQGEMPRWLPAPVGVFAFTLSLHFWLSLHAKMLQPLTTNEALPHLERMALGFGLALSVALAGATWLAQVAWRRTLAAENAVESERSARAKMKAAEGALNLNEERTRSIIESAQDAIVSMNEAGVVLSFNDAAARVFDYSAEEVIGRDITMLMNAPERDRHDDYVRAYLSSERVSRPTGVRGIVGRRRDGSGVDLELTVSTVMTGQGRLLTGILRDVTDRKIWERRLQSTRDALESQNDELARSNRELDEFAYIASHDLKEPLRGIANYAGFLIEDYADRLDEEGNRKLLTLIRAAKRMESLIDSLLYYSRVGRTQLAIEATDLDRALDGVLDRLETTVAGAGIEIRRPRRMPTIHCDRVRVAELFHNLISNAAKYNDKADKWIEIGWLDGREAELTWSRADPAVRTEPTDPPAAIVYVRDNGIGIRDHHRESIFRIFKRLHGREKFGGGTGVGMTIVKKIVEMHHGRVWVESEFGAGPTFYFTLDPVGARVADRDEGECDREDHVRGPDLARRGQSGGLRGDGARAAQGQLG